MDHIHLLGMSSLAVEVREVSVVLPGSDIFVNANTFILRDVIFVVGLRKDAVRGELIRSFLKGVHRPIIVIMTFLLAVVRVDPTCVRRDSMNPLLINISVFDVGLIIPLSVKIILLSIMGSCAGINVGDSLLVGEEVIRGR